MTGRSVSASLGWLALALAISGHARAQDRTALIAMATSASAATAVPDTIFDAPGGLRLLRVAKWSVLAGSAGAAIWGFVQNERADRRFHELELQCEADPVRCRRRTSDGAYEDPVLEARFQEVRSLDRKSHLALLAGQVGLAGSVVLFLLDLGNVTPPPDIPYDPRVSVMNGTTRLAFRLPVGSPR
jgi:hypothetical protein